MLTAKTQVADRVVSLRIGADHYLAKPFDLLELLARMEALLRRTAAQSRSSRPLLQFGSIRMDLRRAEVWGHDALMSTRTVDVHIGWLRQKLEEDPRHPRLIEAVIGLGCKLAPL